MSTIEFAREDITLLVAPRAEADLATAYPLDLGEADVENQFDTIVADEGHSDFVVVGAEVVDEGETITLELFGRGAVDAVATLNTGTTATLPIAPLTALRIASLAVETA